MRGNEYCMVLSPVCTAPSTDVILPGTVMLNVIVLPLIASGACSPIAKTIMS